MPLVLPPGFATPRLRFTPLAVDDAPLIFNSYARDIEVSRYMTWRPHAMLADTQAYVAGTLAMRARTYLLRDRADGQLHGAFEVRQPAPHWLGYGCLLARPSRGGAS